MKRVKYNKCNTCIWKIGLAFLTKCKKCIHGSNYWAKCEYCMFHADTHNGSLCVICTKADMFEMPL